MMSIFDKGDGQIYIIGSVDVPLLICRDEFIDPLNQNAIMISIHLQRMPTILIVLEVAFYHYGIFVEIYIFEHLHKFLQGVFPAACHQVMLNI